MDTRGTYVCMSASSPLQVHFSKAYLKFEMVNKQFSALVLSLRHNINGKFSIFTIIENVYEFEE